MLDLIIDGLFRVAFFGWLIVVVENQLKHRALVRSNDRLVQYNDWFEEVDLDELSDYEVKALLHEREAIVELYHQGRSYDGIVERRLKRVEATRD